MYQIVTFFAFLVAQSCVLSQTTEFNNGTRTPSAQDIYDLSEEDFQLWLSGRSPKAWGGPTNISTSTDIPSTTTPVSSTTLTNEITSVDYQTIVDQKTSTTESPTLFTTSSTTAPSNDDQDSGYVYQRPENSLSPMKLHMQQSPTVDNQLITDVNSLAYSGNGLPGQECQLIAQLLQRRPGAISFQSSATIHRFQESTTAAPPFPGNSHHSDIFLSQNQKPQQSSTAAPPPLPPSGTIRVQQFQRQPQLVPIQQHLLLSEPTVIPLRPHGSQRTSEFYGNPAFFRQQWPFSHPAYEAPVALRYY
ncbi:uncharacterized protein LOC131436728 [Malaya genurostris]|uniref:uncharacterized protein LOC131436728 n=1 Tax=Malaya genurostris TaxID=325434 RepID=UPI0026F40747|nr:uncharacterized protein LOC131436728 [Malaya genurostris]